MGHESPSVIVRLKTIEVPFALGLIKASPHEKEKSVFAAREYELKRPVMVKIFCPPILSYSASLKMVLPSTPVAMHSMSYSSLTLTSEGMVT